MRSAALRAARRAVRFLFELTQILLVAAGVLVALDGVYGLATVLLALSILLKLDLQEVA